MALDIDSFIQAVEALDEEELQRDIDELHEQQRQISIELNKRLDALAVKRRWEQQKQPDSPVALPAFGADQDATERVRLHSDPGLIGLRSGRGAGPRGTEAVRRVMKDGGTWSVPQVHAELEKRGWTSPQAKHPAKATETALHRLYQKGELARLDRGIYRYRSPEERQAAEADSGRAET